MKNTAINLIWATTIVLVVVTILSSLNFSFPLIFYLVVFGQLLLIFTVYKVLTDQYKTDKTFDNWYEDHPKPEDE
ncbi:MAG: hypothetical protein ACQEWG_09890 [Bacteroidota bacterium]